MTDPDRKVIHVMFIKPTKEELKAVEEEYAKEGYKTTCLAFNAITNKFWLDMVFDTGFVAP